MRILHFADLHLGVENYGRFDAATGLHSRILDFLRCFDFIVEEAISRRVDLVLFCGDAFRGREPSPTLQYLFAERISQLRAADIPVVILAGNHDLAPLPGRRSSLEMYPILAVPGVKVAVKPHIFRIETRSGPIQVACLPAVGSSEFRGESSEDALGLVTELAAQVHNDCPAILAGHVAVHGARTSSETRIAIGRELILPRDALANPIFQYVALGHIHRFQDLNPASSPPIVYAGSPERVDFSEAEEPKGLVIVDIPDVERSTLNAERVHYTFVPTPSRRFVTVAVELGAGDGTAEVLDAIAKQPIEGAVVKVVLRSREQTPVEEREIRKALAGAQYVVPIAREIERPTARLRAPELARGWRDPMSALEEYLKTTKFSAERKEQLREAAKKLIKPP